MIQIRDACLAYGQTTLFDNLSCVFQPENRVGVVGRNGAGKSTFLKALAGVISLDSGTISKSSHVRIAYMPQEIVLLSSKTAFEETYQTLLDDSSLVPDALNDIARTQARAEKVLKGLGFTPQLWEKPITQLSVGWRMRVVLAKLLLQEAHFYLFDEPTNHLDMVSKEWFLDFLAKARFGFLFVTHERYYLEKVCDHIFEIDHAKGRLFTGNFSAYLNQKEQEAALKQSAYERQQKEISRKQETINRFRASATKAKMAQSMIKQLERIELIELDPVPPTLSFSFRPSTRPGAVVLNFKGLHQSFNGVTLFKNVSGQIERGEKVALVGANGTGKTTLFNLLTGKYPSGDGNVEFGHNVSYAIFEQDQLQALKENQTVYESVLEAAPDISETTIRSFLGAFLFSGDAIHKKIHMLSGGERCRVALVKVLLRQSNMLLLDEPTNHLDMYAKEVLLQALQQYTGSVFIVSHDHDFLQRLVGRIVEITPHGLLSYPGTYEAYLERKKESQTKQENTPTKEVTQASSSSGEVDRKALLKEQMQLERKINDWEEKAPKLHASLSQLTYGTSDYTEKLAHIETLEKDLAAAQERWHVVTDLLSKTRRNG